MTYARDAAPGPRAAGARFPDKPADPIIVHPDIRRMLLTMRAPIEGCARARGCGSALRARRGGEASRRRSAAAEAEDLLALMTPIVKACFTDLGFEAANIAVQVWGGHGYIRDNGMEQLMRDARITQIYEGANGIQALDLVGRKLAGTGRLLRRFFHPVAAFIAEAGAEAAMAEFTLPLAKVFARLQQVTAQIAKRACSDPEEAGAAAASDYLELLCPRRPGLYVGPHGADRARQAVGRGRRFLQSQACDRPVLLRANPAAPGGTVPDAERGQGEPDGDGTVPLLTVPATLSRPELMILST